MQSETLDKAIDAEPEGVSSSMVDATATALACIGGRIREIRQLRGLTLQTLAKASGLSPSMLSLVERGRASPSIGSLIVIASGLGVTMSDLLVTDTAQEEKLVVRITDAPVVETKEHVVRRLLREDRAHGISVAINEYEPHTGSNEQPISHEGFEYGFVLKGQLTVEVDGVSYKLSEGDLIAYSSKRLHKIWNDGRRPARTLWFNMAKE